MVSYQTAWLKANHPVEFMAGVMNCDIHLTDKLSVYAEEVRRGGLDIEIVPPCINRSIETFSVSEGRCVYALGALKNVGGLEAMKLVVEGGRGGDKPFVNLYDVARRVDLKRVGKRPLEMMARAGGAFDVLDDNRRKVFDSLDALVSYSAAIHEQRASAQVSLFGEAGEDLPEPRLSPVGDWLPNERLAEEHKAIGFYLTGHPLDDYLPALKRKGVLTLDGLREKAEKNGAAVGKVAVIVGGLQQRKSGRGGTQFFRMNISDPTGQVSGMALFPDDFEKTRRVFDETLQVVMTLEGRFNEGQFDPIARSVAPIDAVVADAGGMALNVHVDRPAAIEAVASLLANAAETARGIKPGEVSLTLMDPPTLPGEVDMTLGKSFPLNPQIKGGAIKSITGGVVHVEEV